MAETNGDGKAASSSAAPSQGTFRIVTQYIKDLSFENPGAPRSLRPGKEPPKVKINVNVGARKIGDALYESSISLEANSSTDDGTLYNLELEYAGLFQLDGIPDNALQPVLFINCPMMVYPFVRRLAADLTHEGGFQTLYLEPIDFASLYMRNADKISAARQQQLS
jgi:preprotein translocase subunit SecB